jgi:hypothetical protein
VKYILTYLPVSLVHSNKPRVFESEYDARVHLLLHICDDCLKGFCWEDETDEREEPPDVNDILSLLGTCCGCEWSYEEIE